MVPKTRHPVLSRVFGKELTELRRISGRPGRPLPLEQPKMWGEETRENQGKSWEMDVNGAKERERETETKKKKKGRKERKKEKEQKTGLHFYPFLLFFFFFFCWVWLWLDMPQIQKMRGSSYFMNYRGVQLLKPQAFGGQRMADVMTMLTTLMLNDADYEPANEELWNHWRLLRPHMNHHIDLGVS